MYFFCHKFYNIKYYENNIKDFTDNDFVFFETKRVLL